MKKIIKNWANISVYAGALVALIAVIGNWDFREKTLLISLTFIFLHFFEEFSSPGGFAFMGLNVEMGIADTDAKKWTLNNLNAWFGNWWCAIFVYLIPVFFSEIRFLTLAAVIFGFIEVLGHLFLFNIAIKGWYNPGLITALFGLMPISINYFIHVWGQHLYSVKDLFFAVLWIVFHYWFSFRSPIYKKMGTFSDKYYFSEEEVLRGKHYIKHRLKETIKGDAYEEK